MKVKYNVYHRAATRYRTGRIKWIRFKSDDGCDGHCVTGAVMRLSAISAINLRFRSCMTAADLVQYLKCEKYIRFLNHFCMLTRGCHTVDFNDARTTRKKDILKLLDECGDEWDKIYGETPETSDN